MSVVVSQIMSHNILAVGEVLWDLLPSGKQLGGAPANFTFHCRSLGAEAQIVTRVGDDELGREILDRFRTLRLPTDLVQIDSQLPTGTVDVALAPDGQPRFTICEHVAWDRIAAPEDALAAASRADAVCFGSLAQRSEPARRAIRTLVSATRPEALRLFDVNLRRPFVDQDIVADSLELTDALKLNDQELPELAKMLGLPAGDRAAMSELAHRFGLRLVALTRGAAGALLLAEGCWSDDLGRSVTVRDTVGAGDAFTAALAIGFLSGRPLDAINRHANQVAAFVCSQPGGTPNLPDELKRPASSPSEASP
jgi:fructokinase